MLKLPPTHPHPCGTGFYSLQDQTHRQSFDPRAPVAQNPIHPHVPSSRRVCHRGSPALALRRAGWHTGRPGSPVLPRVGVTVGARGGLGRGLTPLAAWAAPACAGTVRGEGQTEEFAIWASLLLSCCYGTAEMLLGRRWWPACVTPGLPRGREMSPVCKASLFTQPHQGRIGVLMVKYTRWLDIQSVSVQLIAAFNKVR